MIEKLTGFPDQVLAFAYKGHIIKADYDAILLPSIANALKNQDKIRIYIEIDPSFSGIGPGAIWEDFKIGVEHLRRWGRIVVVTDVEWIRHAMQLFSFLMPGEMKAVPFPEASWAREWITESN